ncbi:WYL domain-containing protein [Cupriavidus basilensis]|uniref:WYL domain-containing protein n=1 Tax=Cupriavidus basilensis TaxID=68895 RepID=UPI0023E8C27D|nr:WYL domain-containing protein [Cupriavidus basilensis]MDF3887898.1 WYL domain-containing protein [Cupriavidus basilensis]
MGMPLTPAQLRLRDMEVLLRWEGEIDNSRLREVFGIQSVQASRLLAAFLAEFADTVTRATPYAPITATQSFRPRLAGKSPDEYLQLIQKLGASHIDSTVEDLRLDLAPVRPTLFAIITQACRRRVGLRIRYRSLAAPEGQDRLVYPHVLVRAARRWHARAWCAQRQAFRDFALGRIARAALDAEPAPAAAQTDKDWSEFVRLIVQAHPGLPDGQARLLRDEYLGGEESRTLRVRRCLVGYTVQDLRIATEPARQTPPEYQLALSNTRDFVGEFGVGGG